MSKDTRKEKSMEKKPISPNAELKDCNPIGLYEPLAVDDCVGTLPHTTEVVINAVLDKIRAEIQALRGCSCWCSDGVIDDVEDILDKYKAEIVEGGESNE